MVELTCICCPIGCKIVVEGNSEADYSVSGNGCVRGRRYALQELTHPVRTVTSTVMVDGCDCMLSVKTDGEVPREKVFAVMEEIKAAHASLPVKVGDVIIEDVAQTGINVVATKNIEGEGY